ncbi:MAG: AAA family ATPase [Smithella sp.]
MIRRFKLTNYKSLKNIDVKLPNLVVIFGPNAAGKSNLFDALNLFSRIVTKKNLKEAFAEHRGVPLEVVHYASGGISGLKDQEYHDISFVGDIELSDDVIREVESRIRELRRGIENVDSSAQVKNIITHRLLRYEIDLQVSSLSGQVRVMNERLTALRRDGSEKTRTPFIEKVKEKINLRMEGQSHPTYHDIGLDYAIASTALYAPHYPHITALKEELSRCHFYFLEPRELMRQGNAIAKVTNIGPRGEDLAAFYFTLKEMHPQQFKAVKLAAMQILPRLNDLEIERTAEAELFLRLCEDNAFYSNRLISEGTLRVLGLLAVLSPVTGSTTIGYEEPENGVHPRRLKNIAELLKNAADQNRQILINTHSPILPTYFSNKDLLVCQRYESGTDFIPFSTSGPLFRNNDIEQHLEEEIVRGDFGG